MSTFRRQQPTPEERTRQHKAPYRLKELTILFRKAMAETW